MNFLYEAIDANGQRVLGKLDARDAQEAEQNLANRGLRAQSLAATQRVGTPAPISPSAPASPSVAPLNMTAPLLNSEAEAFTPAPVATPQQIQSPAAPPAMPSTIYAGQNGFNGNVTLGGGGQLLLNANGQAALQTGQAMQPIRSTAPALTTGAGLTPPNTQAKKTAITMSGNAARTQTKMTRTQQNIALKQAQPAAPDADVSTLGGVKTKDLMMFFRQLASLVHSGISLYGALDNLAPRTQNPNLSKAAREMGDKARNGGSVADVMTQYPRIFPEHVVGTVRAGETGGYIEIALAEIAVGYEENIALYRTSWLPKTMATQAFFLFALAQPLFPTLFPGVLDGAMANLILYLKLVLLRNLPITIALYLLIRLAGSRLQLPQYRYFRDNLSLKLPPFGELQREKALAAFLRSLGRLFRSGVAPINAWEGAMNTASNVVIRERLAHSYALMQQGSSLGEAFTATGLFNDQVENLMITGEASGQVGEMLEQATTFYDERSKETAGKAKFMMLRLGILAMLILGGGTMAWLAHTYFKSIFDFADHFAD